MNFKPILSRLLLVSFMLVPGFTANANAGSEPVWKLDFAKKIKWFEVAPTGHLLVSTDKALVGVDPENGKVLWKLEAYKKIQQAPEKLFGHWFDTFVPFTPYAIIMKFSGANKTMKSSSQPYYFTLLNVITGEEIWSAESMGIKSDYGHILAPEIGGVLLYVKDKNKKKTMLLASLETGKTIWENQSFFKKRNPEMIDLFPTVETPDDDFFGEASVKKSIIGNQPPLFDTDETMITFMNKKAIRKWNAKTGELIWETEIKAKKAPAYAYGYAPMLLSETGDVLYAAVDKKVFALRTDDGGLLWQKAPKLKGGVTWMQLIPKGLVVGNRAFLDSKLGKPFITVLNVATGQPLWKKPFTGLKDATNFAIKDDLILVCANKKLYAINIADGAAMELANNLKFKGKETPEYLALREDGYFLQSSNNLMLISQNGQPVFQTYYKAPGLSMLERIAAKQIWGLTQHMMSKGWEVDVDDLRKNYPAWMHGSHLDQEAFSDYMWEKRFKSSKNRETYTYMLTRIETDTAKGLGLVKVNKINGKTEGQLILGTKNPVYELDEYENRLFFKAGDKEIVCYSF
ncbi:MAG: PQQ-binding-like beta-propeller repeat protein [bacterium]